MGLRDFLARSGRWFRSESSKGGGKPQQAAGQKARPETEVMPAPPERVSKEQSLEKLEKLEKGFSNMVSHLEGIDKNLQTLPELVENQKHLTEKLLEYIRESSNRERRLIEVVEKLPAETVKEARRFVFIIAAAAGLVLIVLGLLLALLIYP